MKKIEKTFVELEPNEIDKLFETIELLESIDNNFDPWVEEIDNETKTVFEQILHLCESILGL